MYLEAFMLAVPTDREALYKEQAAWAANIFVEHGAARVLENWPNEVPMGKVTSFPQAVELQEGESVIVSWIEYPDKETRLACVAACEADPRFTAESMAEVSFDMARLIMGGFEVLADTGATDTLGHVEAVAFPVPEGKREAYAAAVAINAEVMREAGATRVIDAWGDGLSWGERTSWPRGLATIDGETVALQLLIFPDTATRDQARQAAMQDPRMADMFQSFPGDGKRAIFGGFTNFLDITP